MTLRTLTTKDTTDTICIRIVALPFLDVAELPLHLPPPSAIECGGYMNCSQYQYSPIDLLVAGLEATRLSIKVSSLTNFFDQHPSPLLAEHEIYIQYKINSVSRCGIYSNNIAWIKTQNFTPLLKVLHKYAPFTFKGVF